ncbi:Leucine rich repeat protein (plasmid) [Caballeronia sp. SBC1]|uniref:leucine-rich repeat-containing protein kinase family protein n=1 Tax=unclassified Caballeronia TaxID=2646786 RepID=UPI0013E16C85|nr:MULTISPECIES: leucine-rich repeat-containing protein kinase family protein [unclassified Caballeronia]QIE28916.1 Leucine rich repeat protein [Caballeronia sp. SBC2]QIN66971.1 Leucine rich repeat protein [Caballeronia sp. SBC1]
MTSTLEQLRTGQLAGTQRLALTCGLTEFPREIFDLSDTLEVLDLSGNALSSLPDDLPRLTNLHTIFCSNNQFVELPEVLGRCTQLSMVGFKANRIRKVSGASLPPKLRWLILTDNEVEALPPEIGNCTQLQKLMLAGNLLRTLPVELAECSRLELIRLSANQLTELPVWVASLPRLSWLACAGNPFNEQLEAKAMTDTPVADIPWQALDLQHRLGEGASGVIHRAEHRSEYPAISDGTQPVAVKLFKGAVTSDGLPHCEMAACIAAGAHPNLIPVLGKIEGHPTGVHGLVMELINPQLRNLAGPPSLESCTRDIYDLDTRFDLTSALSVAHGIASAARHLHQQGIMHGDLYAHNILHGGQGQALMGDFGAASFYATDDQALAPALQRLEVRAFGCLLEELIDRCDVQESAQSSMAALASLKNDCLSEQTGDRPLFGDIVNTLSALRNSHRNEATSS